MMTTNINHDGSNDNMVTCTARRQQHILRKGVTIAAINLNCDDSHGNMLSPTMITSLLWFVMIDRFSHGVQSITRVQVSSFRSRRA